MLDFPNSPTSGATFSGPGGILWSWDGTKWVAAGTTTTSYAPLNSPQFTGDPQAPTAAAGDNDTSIATTAFAQAAVAPALNDVGRNLLHNPLFNIAQRGAGPFTTHNAYTADRWRIGTVLDTCSFTVNSAQSFANSVGDDSAQSYLTNTFTGNAGASANTYLDQPIEKVSRISGKTVTVSFWANASAALKLGVNLYQLFGTGGSPSANSAVQATGNAIALSGTLTRYSTTFVVPSLSGKTLGTNRDDCTLLRFWFTSGATSNQAAGNIGIQSGTINLWGVQLEISSVATPLEKPDPQQELAKCQRFYQVTNLATRFTAASAGQFMTVPFSFVPMRASPTAALTTAPNNTNIGSRSVSINSVSAGRFDVSALSAGLCFDLDTTWTLTADL